MSAGRAIRIALGLLLAAAACRPPPPESRPLRISVAHEPSTIDPSKAYDVTSFYIITNLWEGLTRYGPNLEVEGAVARMWSFSEDMQTVTFTLRDDVSWSDGRPVVAGDFVYSWRRLLDPETAGEYAYFLYDIVNAVAINEGEMPVESLGVQAPDDHTLVVQLARPAIYFPHLTTFMSTMPLRRDVIEAHGRSWLEPEHLVTNGAYRLTDWQHDYRIQLAANPDYYRGPPGIERVEVYTINSRSTALALYDRGDLDMVLELLPLAIPHYADRPDYTNLNKLEVRYLAFHLPSPPFDDVRVRQAFTRALRREEYPAILRGGEIPTRTWLPAGILGHNPDIGLRFDPQEARRLLAEAGYPDGRGFPEVTLLFRSGDDWRLIAETIQGQIQRELGVGLRLENRDSQAFFQALENDPPPLHLARWVADFPDPENFMGLFTSTSGNNEIGFSNAMYDDRIDRAVRVSSREERQALYDEAQRALLVEATAIAPLYVAAQNHLVRPGLQGLTFNPMDVIYLGGLRWAE